MSSSLFGGALFGGPIPAAATGTTTASQLVYTALRIAGILAAPGRGYSPEEFGDGLDTLNALIDSWNIEFGTIPAILRTLWPLVNGQQTYQIGPGAVDFNGARPSKIERASMLITTGGNLIEKKMRVIEFPEWQAIPLKATKSSIPRLVYYDRASPIGNLNIYETPSDSTSQIVLYTASTLGAIPDATTQFSLPPGYLRALGYSLAVELAPRFPGRATLSDLAIETAIQSKGMVMSLNARSPRMRSDGDLPSNAGGLYSWLTGEESE